MNDGLNKISGCDSLTRKGDVIFVHGLGGDALGTWHPKGIRNSQDSWLYWFGQDIPNIGIWSLGYEAEPFAWRGSTMPLVDRATHTLAVLDADEIGKRPLVFITHSLGGLLVKQMFRHAMDYGELKWREIVKQTKGIVFLSTPHSGSDLANWVNYIGGILRTTVSVDELESHHSRLRELNIWYRNNEILTYIPMEVYCEKKKTNGILVVNETSADPGIKGVIPIPMSDDHLSICRPLSRETLTYKRIKNFISSSLTLDATQNTSKNVNFIEPTPLVLQAPQITPIPLQLYSENKEIRFEPPTNELHPLITPLKGDYDELLNLLTNQQWKEADLETTEIFLKIAKRQKWGWLRSIDIANISCSDLRMIDQLWSEASGGHFGFKAQRNIWLSVDGQLGKFDRTIFCDFGDKVGWRIDDQWLECYDDFYFSLDAPKGHLPSFRFPTDRDQFMIWQESFKNFLPRLENCF